MNIKQLREITGLTQQKFGERFKIPLRSVQNWESGQRQPPEYLPRLIELVMILERENDQLRSGQTYFDTEEEQDPQQQQPQEEEKDTQRVQEPKNEKELLRQMKHSLEDIEIEDLYCDNCVYGKECKYDYKQCKYYKEYSKPCDTIENWIYWEDLERMIEK